VKVIHPDSTGLDAARAIGPKLAEQAVLVRSNGDVRDLRLPLEDGQRIQILTTRDKDDPDALYVLRHSAAHLLAEAAQRLYPGTKVAIGPPIENGFYYDFEFPEPVTEEALQRLEEEIRREIAGRSIATRRSATSSRKGSRTRSSWSTLPTGTSPSTSRGISSISAADRTFRTRSRSRR
jgi:threonyl-tRNA synthetase